MSEKEMADWLDGLARDMSDLADDGETSARLRRSAEIIRAQIKTPEATFPYIVVPGGKK